MTDNYYEKYRQRRNEATIKSYYRHKDRISERRKIKVQCDCGKVLSYCSLSTHKKSKTHISIMENKSIQASNQEWDLYKEHINNEHRLS